MLRYWWRGQRCQARPRAGSVSSPHPSFVHTHTHPYAYNYTYASAIVEVTVLVERSKMSSAATERGGLKPGSVSAAAKPPPKSTLPPTAACEARNRNEYYI